jgi:UDP-glucose 4-epimerase
MKEGKKMKSLVTGGAGFIGSNLVDRLLEIGHEVVVIDNESSDAHEYPYWNLKAQNHKVDICDYASTRKLYDGVDYVFHLAAEARIQPTINDPVKATLVNTLGTNVVLQCAREAGVKRVMYSSTSAAYGKNPLPNKESQPDDCLNPYSVSKVNGEKLCTMYTQLFGLETVIFRYFNAYGNRQPIRGQYAPVMGIFGRQKSNGEPLTIVGDGEQKRDFVNVLDIVEANVLASIANLNEHQIGAVFNIGSGTNYSVNEVAKMYNHPTVNIPERVGEMRETLADTLRANVILGWYPQIKLEEWLNEN